MRTIRAQILFVLLIAVQGAPAAVVTLCQTHDQPAPAGVFNLLKAVQAGGAITFNCGTATIAITHQIDVLKDVEIDGAGAITLDGRNTASMFNVRTAGVRFGLNRLTMVRGHVPAVAGIAGSLVQTSVASTITISNSRLTDSADALFIFGPASLNIDHTQISSNRGSFLTVTGGAKINIIDSEIFGNQGAALNACTLTVSRSRFTNNRSRIGGAFQTGCATAIDHTDFENNQAVENGGAIYFSAPAMSMALRAVKFTGNTAGNLGGAIAIEPSMTPRTLQIRYGEFFANRGKSGGAVNIGNFIENDATLDAAVVLFKGNIATNDGGALAGTNARLKLRRGVFRDNQAPRGGAISSFLFAPRPGVLANCLFVRNQAPAASAIAASGLRIVNSTIADNHGPALGAQGTNPAPWRDITLVNSIVTNNTGGNCAHSPQPLLNYVNGGRNLQYPGTDCGAGLTVAAPLLDPSYAPVAGGPAYGGGDAAACAAPEINRQDVWGQRRPRAANCSIGAVEADILQQLERRPPKERQR